MRGAEIVLSFLNTGGGSRASQIICSITRDAAETIVNPNRCGWGLRRLFTFFLSQNSQLPAGVSTKPAPIHGIRKKKGYYLSLGIPR